MGTYYGPEWLEDYAMAFWYPAEWLHSEWSQRKQESFDTMYQFDFYRSQFDKILNQDNRQKYFDRYSMDYKDIADPRSAVGSSPVINRSSMLRVSDNLKRLYR